MTTKPIVLWDLDHTLGCSFWDRDQVSLRSFERFDEAFQVVTKLQGEARHGIAATGGGWTSNAIEAALKREGLIDLFDTNQLLPFDESMNQPLGLLGYGSVAGGARSVFVSNSRYHRGLVQRPHRAVAHPSLVEPVLRGEELAYVRLLPPITADLESVWDLLAGLAIVPAHLASEPIPALFALAAYSGIAGARREGFTIETMVAGKEAEAVDLYLIRDISYDSKTLDPLQERIGDSTRGWCPADDGVVVALGPKQSPNEFHPPMGGHGHTLFLRPSHTLLSAVAAPLPTLGNGVLLPDDRDFLIASFAARDLDKEIRPWCGEAPLPTGEFIRSRHADHEHNELAVAALLDELVGIFGPHAVRLFKSDYGRTQLYSVVAEWRGAKVPEEVVMVAAHLDSVANGSAHNAPGADDDASGMAAVLAIARVLVKLRPPERTIRFVLFNGEEVGMLGSLDYSRAIAPKERAGFVALLNMDMIGYLKPGQSNSGAQYELHTAGRSDYNPRRPITVARADEIAGMVVKLGKEVSPPLNAQPYPLPLCPTDPAAKRTDHYPFMAADLPACTISEDLFETVCKTVKGEPAPQTGNPGYHSITDVLARLNPEYLADIARIVAASAWVLANPSQTKN